MREYSYICVLISVLVLSTNVSASYRFRHQPNTEPFVIYGEDIRVTDHMGHLADESEIQPIYVKYQNARGQVKNLEPIVASSNDQPVGGYPLSGKPEASSTVGGNELYQRPQHDQGPNVELVRQKQLEQQKLLNQQYQLQQQKEQYQMRQEQELKRIQEELWKEKESLELERQKLSGSQLQPVTQSYGPPPPLVKTQSQMYGPPPPFVSGQVQAYGPPPPLVEAQPQEYGPPPSGPEVQNVQAYGPPAQEIAPVGPVHEEVVCDEREQVGRTRIIEVKTSAGRICKVKVMPFDRCPETKPFELLVDDDLGDPEVCQGVVNVITAAAFAGNTVSAIPGTVVRGLTHLVDAYDTVKDFYTDLYYRRKAERAKQDHEWEQVRTHLKH